MRVGSRDGAMLSAWRVGDKRQFQPATARQPSALPNRLIIIRYSLVRILGSDPSDPGSSPGGGILSREIKAKADIHVR